MNTPKNNLRIRANHLFAAEQRAQELVGAALLQQDNHQTLENFSTNKPNLDALVLDSDRAILQIHQQLQNAGSRAAQLQAEDKQLNALNQLIYGNIENAVLDDDVIEGEVVEVLKIDN